MLGFDMTNQVIRLGLSNCLSNPVNAKVVLQVIWLLWLQGHGLLNHQDPVLKHYRLPSIINWWTHCVCWSYPSAKKAIGIFFSSSWQGEGKKKKKRKKKKKEDFLHIKIISPVLKIHYLKKQTNYFHALLSSFLLFLKVEITIWLSKWSFCFQEWFGLMAHQPL